MAILCALLFLPSLMMAQFNPAPAQQGVVYVSTSGMDGSRLGTLNPVNGTVTILGDIREFGTNTSIQGITGLAINPMGAVYGVVSTGSHSAIRALYRIDASNGQAELVALIGGANQRGIDFDNNGALWSMDWNGGATELNNINTNDGSVSVVHPNSLNAGWQGGMEIHPTSGQIYVYSWSDRNITRVDPVTGAATEVLPNHASLVSIADIFFDSQGNLFANGGSNNKALYSIDLGSGTVDKVADYGNNFVGGLSAATSRASISTTPVPTLSEWSVAILFLCMWIVGAVAVRQHRMALEVC